MLRYKVIKRKSPLDQSVKYYSQIAPVQPLSLMQICTNISEQSTVTEHDVKAVISALEEQMYKNLRNGASIRLGDIGTFHIELSSKGTDRKDNFTTACIESTHVVYTPSTRILSEISLTHPLTQLERFDDSPQPGKDVIV